MDYKYDIISFDNKIPATLKVENIDSKTRKTELLWHREPELMYVMSGKAECVINGEEHPNGFMFEGSTIIFTGAEILAYAGDKITARYPVNDFIHRPNAVFRQIMRSIKATDLQKETV